VTQVTQVVECLPGKPRKCETLSSSPVQPKKKKNAIEQGRLSVISTCIINNKGADSPRTHNTS
jgi:hypothetical protein